MSIGADEPLTKATATVCAVEDGKVFLVKMWGTLDGHRPAHVFIGLADLFRGEPNRLKRMGCPEFQMISAQPERFLGITFSEQVIIECVLKVECALEGSLDLGDRSLVEAYRPQRFMIDFRGST